MKECHKKLTIQEINQFEIDTDVKLTDKYIEFLLKWNGGKVIPNLFFISDEQGSSVLNVFNGIGEMYDNLEEAIDTYEYRLATGFIPIVDDPAGNVICLGTEEIFYDKIYFWDHEKESEDPNDMSNMYLLANDINEFLKSLYKENGE